MLDSSRIAANVPPVGDFSLLVRFGANVFLAETLARNPGRVNSDRASIGARRTSGAIME
jgi:hypothetical protein